MTNSIFKIVEMILTDDILKHGVKAISLVNDPAIERDFIHFNKEHNIEFKTIDVEKRMVMGPVLIPNKMVLRASENPETGNKDYYYIHFSKDTVRKAAQRFLELGNQKNTTYEHAFNIDGVTFNESWVKEDKDKDKSSLYGYNDLPVGTWFAMARIDNDEIWGEIKNGNVKGFSIEGKFAEMILKQSKEEIDEVNVVDEDLSDEDLKTLKDIIKIIDSLNEIETLD